MKRRVLELHVQPGAKRTEVAGMHGERIKIRLAAPATEGRANAALIEFLAEEFGVAKRAVRILSGMKSRDKRVVIEGDTTEELPWKMPSASIR
jgi:uncharacterized protein (TIGR00251 family)